MLKSRADIQSDPDSMEEWGNRNTMKFNKDKCKCLHLERNPHNDTGWAWSS